MNSNYRTSNNAPLGRTIRHTHSSRNRYTQSTRHRRLGEEGMFIRQKEKEALAREYEIQNDIVTILRNATTVIERDHIDFPDQQSPALAAILDGEYKRLKAYGFTLKDFNEFISHHLRLKGREYDLSMKKRPTDKFFRSWKRNRENIDKLLERYNTEPVTEGRWSEGDIIILE